MNWSLRNRFLLPTIILIVLGIAASAGVSYIQSRNALTDTIEQQLLQRARDTVKDVDEWIWERELNIRSWSTQKAFLSSVKDSFVAKAARKSANEKLAKLKEQYRYYETIAVTDAEGQVVAADSEAAREADLADRGYFRQIMDGEELVISPVLESKASGNPIFVVAAPLEEEGETTGVLVGVINLGTFSSAFIDDIKVGDNGYAYMYNDEGLVIAHPDKSQILELSLQDLDFGSRMLEMGEGIIEYTFNGTESVAAFAYDELTGWTVAIKADRKEVLAPLAGLKWINLAVGAGVVAAAVVLLFLIARSALRPLQQVSELAERAGNGDLSITRAEFGITSRDELGTMADALADMVASQAEMVRRVKEIAASLGASAEQLSGLAESASGSMSEVRGSITQVSELAESNSATVEETNAGIEEVSSGAQSAAKSASEGSQTAEQTEEVVNASAESVADVVAQIKKGSQHTHESAGKTRELAQSVEKIGEFVTVITKIADQTNLLALNAAIEAARAGEAGRGFAVVAEEVRKLAEESNRAAGEVADIIQTLQSGAKASLEANTATEKVMDEVSTMAEKTRSQLAQMLEQVDSIVEGMGDISSVAEEQAASSEEMASAMDQLAQSSTQLTELVKGIDSSSAETAQASDGVAGEARNLSRSAEELASLLARFTLDRTEHGGSGLQAVE